MTDVLVDNYQPYLLGGYFWYLNDTVFVYVMDYDQLHLLIF